MLYEVKCPECGLEWISKTSRGRFCSPSCQSKAWARAHPKRRRAQYLKRKPKLLAYNAKRRREMYRKFPWIPAIESAKQRARKIKRLCDLTQEWARARWTGRCELTGIPFMNTSGMGPGPKRLAPSIDRIDSKKGYTKDNCRFVLLAINAFKHDGTDAEMLSLAKALIAATTDRSGC